MKKAVLLIHGLAGGTYDLENLTNYLQIKNFDTFTFTLPGHDSKVRVTKEDWLESCENHLKLIINSGYKEIYLVGHSMGGVLAAYLASKYKEVKKIVLAAAAFKHILSEYSFVKSINEAKKIIKDYTLNVVLDRINKVHPLCLNEFLHLVKDNQAVLGNIKCPILIIHGIDDNLVPVSSSLMIFNNVNSKVKKLLICDNCNHHIFKNSNQEIVKYVEKFLSRKIYIKKIEFINL